MKEKLYLITGGTGHLGRTLIQKLMLEYPHADIRALCLPKDPVPLPDKVQRVAGDIVNRDSLADFFDVDDYESVTLIHCAAFITIATKKNPNVWKVNVNGTANIISWCQEKKISRMVYVSSVHAIPEKEHGQAITEINRFSPKAVHGQYAKSKAAAASLVLEAAKNGLNVSIVHPSGIVGPGDLLHANHLIQTIDDIARGKLKIGVKGGYDIVDVEDVAEGIIQCEEKGKRGECYILSGHYCSIRRLMETVCQLTHRKLPKLFLPTWVAAMFAPISEFFSRLGHKKTIYTPYAIYTLKTNANFSNFKAKKLLHYKPRPLQETLRRTLKDLAKHPALMPA